MDALVAAAGTGPISMRFVGKQTIRKCYKATELDISDAVVVLICVPNILGLYFLAPIVKREMDDYLRRLNSGEIKRFKNA